MGRARSELEMTKKDRDQIDNNRFAHLFRQPPQSVMPNIRTALNRYATYSNYIYVGRTSDTKKRFADHQRNLHQDDKKWDIMIVVYETSSLHNVILIENMMIAHIKEGHRFAEPRWNEKGVQYDGPQLFYVYLLVDTGVLSNRSKTYEPEPDYENCYEGGLSGWYNPIEELKEIIDRHAKPVKKSGVKPYVYVGVTNSPSRRFPEHQALWRTNDRWEKMIVLYETSFFSQADSVERTLIHYLVDKGYNYLNTQIPREKAGVQSAYILLDRMAARRAG